MVNDKMVNRFMTKKQYIFPLVEVVHFETESIMHVDSLSNTEFPGGPAGAPARKVDVF